MRRTGISEKRYEFVVGVIFLLIALGHLLRVIFGVSFAVYGIPVPMWASVVAVVVMGLLAFKGFRLAQRHL